MTSLPANRLARRAQTSDYPHHPARIAHSFVQVGARSGAFVAHWVLADCTEDLHGQWINAGHGPFLDTTLVTHVAWADDIWVFDACPHGLESMLTMLSAHARSRTGLITRWGKCGYAHATGEPQVLLQEDTAPMLSKMDRDAPGQCPKVLGSFVQIGPKLSQERDAVRRSCWAAFHMRRNFWRTRGHVVQKICMLHLSIFPVLSWCAFTRYWIKRELAEGRTMQPCVVVR